MAPRQLRAALPGCVDFSGCEDPVVGYPDVDREDAIPADIAKRGPDTDQHPPVMHSPDFDTPVPLPYPVNTAGAEDSPFILPDGNTLYFFFTPGVRVHYSQQLFDQVTGIYVTQRTGETWSDRSGYGSRTRANWRLMGRWPSRTTRCGSHPPGRDTPA